MDAAICFALASSESRSDTSPMLMAGRVGESTRRL
jgi:hypothetical protein